jgi:hypothetical protein
MLMTNKHCAFGLPVEVQYITELRNLMRQSLKCVDKNGQAIDNSQVEGMLVFASAPRMVPFGIEQPQGETDNTTPHFDMNMSYARGVRTASLTSYPVRCKILHQRTASLSQSQMTSRGRCYARA